MELIDSVKVDILAESVRDYETMAGLVGYGWADKEEHKQKIKDALSKWFTRMEKMVTVGGYAADGKPSTKSS